MSDNDKEAAEREQFQRMEIALQSIRKAAGSARHFTNRLQFIYERAGVALANEDWSEEWKATNGYKMRADILQENERLNAEVASLRAALTASEAAAQYLRAAIIQTLNANRHLADGDTCTLLPLKVALRETGDPWEGDSGEMVEQEAQEPGEREAALQGLIDQAQELDMGYGPNACPTCGKSGGMQATLSEQDIETRSKE